jgi:hypothetical protein
LVIEAMGHIVAVAIASFKEAVAEDIAGNRILPRTDVGEGPKGDASEGPKEEVGGLPIAPIAEEGSK